MENFVPTLCEIFLEEEGRNEGVVGHSSLFFAMAVLISRAGALVVTFYVYQFGRVYRCAFGRVHVALLLYVHSHAALRRWVVSPPRRSLLNRLTHFDKLALE